MYFDLALRADVLERMAETMAPDGVLFVGEHEEASRAFEASGDGPGIYFRKRAALSRAV